MTKQSVSYERAPSKELCALLAKGEFLSPICDLHRNNFEVQGLVLDVHFRSNDCLHVYCGLTRLFDIQRMRRGGVLRISADPKHTQYDRTCGKRFFRDWTAHDPELKAAMDSYLKNVKVGQRHKKEGRVQMQWSRVTDPWISFDREARLRYSSAAYRREATIFEEVEDAYRSLCMNYDNHRNETGRSRWAKAEKTARKLDQLAVDPDGRLVLVELKDAGGQSKEVYYSPFQLLQYVWEWHEALKTNAQLLAQVQSLLDSRAALGLLKPTARLNGSIRAAVCFGCDGRTDEVKQRFRFVLNVCNRHLPKGVCPIETWAYGTGAPVRTPDDS